MNFVHFFSQFANNFKNHYQQLTESVQNNRTPNHFTQDKEAVKPESPEPKQAVDKYTPTEKANPEVQSSKDEPKATYDKPVDRSDDTAPETDERQRAEFYSRRAKLDYKMNLQFDLAAIQGIAEQISDGDTESVTEFAAAGFGLNANLVAKGIEIIETNMADKLDADQSLSYRSRNRSVLAQRFGAQSKNFKLQSAYREASSVSRSMDVETFDNYRRSVNKFALRYRLDSNFSFGFVNKFNVQTKEVAETDPANLNNYINSAGNVAEMGTTEMMATFFDTVDQYLASAEADLTAKAEEFYTMAVEQLGFAEETVGMVRDQLIGSIESFFNRVDEAVNMLSSKFVTPEISTPEVDVIVPDIPVSTEDKTELAIA